MPQFGLASPDEVKTLERKTRATWGGLEEYTDFLKTIRPESWGYVIVEDEEQQRALKMRMSKAASSIDKRLKWAPRGKQGEDRLYFKLLSPEEDARQKALRRRNGRHQ